MQEQPFKRLFFLQKQTAARYRSKTANSAGQGQKPPAVQVQTKNRKQPRFRSEIGILSGKCANRTKQTGEKQKKTEKSKSQVLWRRAERKKKWQ